MKKRLKLKQLLLGMVTLQAIPALGTDLDQWLLRSMTQSSLSSMQQWYSLEESSDDPILLLKNLSPLLKDQFQAPAGVTEGYTIEEHTGRVLERFDQFKTSISLPEQISERDFILFLSLHDIGKHLAKTKVAAGLYDSKVNEKTLELIYSRRIFKKISREIGINPQTTKILSRLLHSDTIGDYIKGTHSQNAAYNLLVRDASKCSLEPLIFFNLHKVFHQIDAGSYPTLAMLFTSDSLIYADGTQEKIKDLEDMFGRFESIKPELKSKLELLMGLIVEAHTISEEMRKFSQSYVPNGENVDYFFDQGYQTLSGCQDHKREQIEKALIDLQEPLYQLRLELYYSGKLEAFSPILTLLSEKKHDISLFYQSFSSPRISSLFYHLFELEKLSTPEIVDISAVHGSNSGILIGLMQTSATLYPTGVLTKLGITPLSGELDIGATITGVNRDRLSGYTPHEGFKSLDQYASKFHVTIDSLHERIADYIKKSEIIEITDMEEYIIERRSLLTGLSFQIKQLKALTRIEHHRELLNPLRTIIERDLADFESFKKTEKYLTQMPPEFGGTHRDRYYAMSYSRYSSGLELCMSAFDQEVEPVSQMSLQILNDPFPILFAATLPWHRSNECREVNFSGPLMLGKDLPYIFVPQDKIDFLRGWVDLHVPGKKKPAIKSIEESSFIDTHERIHEVSFLKSR